jgi:pyridoxal phosphate enzyme (YggS family)
MDTLARRAEEIRVRVAEAADRSGRPANAVSVVAVSKTISPDAIRQAFDAGFTTFGENRVQEARDKIPALPLPGIRWELIGHLQTNKVARAVELFSRIQSVDSLRLAEALNGAAARQGRVVPILLEVNVAQEASKSGLAPDDLLPLAIALEGLPALRPEGLMTVAPLVEDVEEVRPIFQELRRLRDQLRRDDRLSGEDAGLWRELSMGMSDDFAVAIEEGATIVRIGRALFGARALAPQQKAEDDANRNQVYPDSGYAIQ